ncbi:hypothetical protein Scel_21580 [Streptomyces cellostaticus]|nr:hypothetical protein Scel_21580 [Streptomyces cellostaticus]
MQGADEQHRVEERGVVGGEDTAGPAGRAAGPAHGRVTEDGHEGSGTGGQHGGAPLPDGTVPARSSPTSVLPGMSEPPRMPV